MQEPCLLTCDTRRIEMERVVTDDSFALSTFTVFSHSDVALQVWLRSSAGEEQLTFQLKNENIRAGAIDDPDSDPEDWNQLFNEVGLGCLRRTRESNAVALARPDSYDSRPVAARRSTWSTRLS